MPAEQYHADCAPSPSLSASVTKILLRESPYKAWFSHPKLNPDYREEREDKFDLGTCAHAVLLEDDASRIAVIDPIDFPAEKTGNIPEGWTNKAIRAARDNARAVGKTPLLKADYQGVERMVTIAKAFIAKSEIAELWQDGESEVTAICQDKGVWLRARFDRFSQAHRFIGDYKSTVDASPDAFSRLLVRMGYHLQDAFYRRVARILGIQEPDFVFLAQSVEPPHECSLHACDPALQEIADAEVERAIFLWQDCIKTSRWPSYGPRIHYAVPTSYMMTEHEIRMAA
jgi:hypothetical protein